jgi:hypothetical protein
MVSKKDKIKKIVKKLKGKRVPKKKKTGQKQKQKQSVVQNVRIAQAPNQRSIGFPSQVIQVPSSDTEFLRSVIQQQNQNNLTRMYEAKNPQQGMRLDDQIGLRTELAFPQPPSPQIEATIPEEQTPTTTAIEVNPQQVAVTARLLKERKPQGFWSNMSSAELAQRVLKSGEEYKDEKAAAQREINRRKNLEATSASDAEGASILPKERQKKKSKALAPRPNEAVFLPEEKENPKLTQIYKTMRGIDVINNDEKQNIFM